MNVLVGMDSSVCLKIFSMLREGCWAGAKKRGLVGIAADQNRDMGLSAFSKYLRGLFRNDPAIDNRIELKVAVGAHCFQKRDHGNAAELFQEVWTVRNSQVVCQAPASFFSRA